ncbi:hypothetical protein MNBD_GAMMA12-3502 [hydrothermal vent metagenome]|uniref:Uncharacterized protein n=1 Tax=hydrothermal vent metagenome TaxID=652676 RepID=A0A3B0YF20_9ZZZZ
MRKSSLSASIGTLVTMLFGATFTSHASNTNTATTVKETLIIKNSMLRKENESTGFRYFVISPNHKRHAFVRIVQSDEINSKNISHKEKKYQLVVDGKRGRICIDIQNIVFSKDSQRILYVCTNRNSNNNTYAQVILNDKAGPSYPEIQIAAFSADNKHISYSVKQGKYYYLVLNHKKIIKVTANDINMIYVSPNGKRLAASIQSKEGTHIFIDGKYGKNYPEIKAFKFSPDSQHFTYTGSSDDDDDYRIVLDGKQLPVNKDADYPEFSADSHRFAYSFGKDGDSWLVINLKTNKKTITKSIYYFINSNQYSSVSPSHTYTSPNGKEEITVQYVEKDKKYFIVFKKKRSKLYESIDNILFSPDSKKIALIANKIGHDSGPILVMNGKQVTKYDYYAGVAFGPDSLHLAYYARPKNGGNMRIVVNKKEGRHYPKLLERILPYSYDFKNIYFAFGPNKTITYYIRKPKTGDIYHIEEQF